MADLPSLDEQLKVAQIEKARAEVAKLLAEAAAAKKTMASGAFSEAIKIIAGVVVGVGGFVAASTQYEVAELRAKHADEQVKAAEKAASEALAAASSAHRRKEEAERVLSEYKETFEQQQRAAPLHQGEARPRLVYIQFRGGMSRSRANGLRDFLSGNRFNAPGAERVPGDYGSLLKYFSDSDAEAAANLKTAVEKYLKQQGCNETLRLVKPGNPSGKASPLEIWLQSDCK
jgi:hypothetical protein